MQETEFQCSRMQSHLQEVYGTNKGKQKDPQEWKVSNTVARQKVWIIIEHKKPNEIYFIGFCYLVMLSSLLGHIW